MSRLLRWGGRALLALVLLAAAVELVYLAYANWRLPELIARQAERAGLQAQRVRAYSLYPGHLRVRELSVSDAAGKRWKANIADVELRVFPGKEWGAFQGVLSAPAQSVRLVLGHDAVDAQVAGAFSGEDLSTSPLGARGLRGALVASSASWQRGGHVLRARAELRLSSGHIVVDRKHMSSLQGSFEASGENTEHLLTLLGLEGAVHWLFPQLADSAWQVRGHARQQGAVLALEKLQAASGDVRARGAVTLGGEERSGALLLEAGATRLGLSLAGERVDLIFAPEPGWLERTLKRRPVELSRVSDAPSR